MRVRREVSSMPSSRSNSQMAVLLRHQQALQLVGQARDHALHGGNCWSRKLRSRASSSASHRSVAAISSSNCGGEDLVAPFVLVGEGRVMAAGAWRRLPVRWRPTDRRICSGAASRLRPSSPSSLSAGGFGWRRFRRPAGRPGLRPGRCRLRHFRLRHLRPRTRRCRSARPAPDRCRMVRVRRAKAFWSRSAPRQLGEILAGAFLDEGPPQIDRLARRRRAAFRRSASRAPSGPATSASGASSRSCALRQAPR